MLCALFLYVSGGAYREGIAEEIFFFSYFVLMADLEYEPGLYV